MTGIGSVWGTVGDRLSSSLRLRANATGQGNADARTSGRALLAFKTELGELDEALSRLGQRDLRQSTGSVRRSAVARGELAIGRTVVDGTAASLRSTEEINTVATSYSTHSPEWDGASQADVSLTGVYDGSQGDDTLRFEVTATSILGLTDAEIDVFDSDDNLIDQLAFSPNGELRDELSNGLVVTLDSLDFAAGDTFSVDVSGSVGTSVNPDAAFNGAGDGSPEFDPGSSVGAGAFSVNGVSIAVGAGDSLNDVLARITASNAGVRAEFDSSTEAVVFTQKSTGAEPTITLGADSSGLFDAVKLSSALVTPGEDEIVQGSRDALIEQVAALDEVRNGSFAVNGQVIEVDVAADSVSDVLGRISAVSGLNATIAESGDIRIDGAGSAFELSGDDSGLLAALGLDQRRYSGSRGKSGERIADAEGVRGALFEVRESLQGLMQGTYSGVPVASLVEVRSRLATAVGSVFSDRLDLSGSGKLRSGLGVDLTALTDENVRSLQIDSGKLSRSLRASDGRLIDLLFGGEEGEVGLVSALRDSIAAATETLQDRIDRDNGLGGRLDVFA